MIVRFPCRRPEEGSRFHRCGHGPEGCCTPVATGLGRGVACTAPAQGSLIIATGDGPGGREMRAIVMLAAASLFLGIGAAAGQELISKDAIKATLLGPTRAIGKKQRAAVDLPTVTFDFNSAALTTQGEQQLDILASAVKEIGLAQQTLTIEGHTDASGSETYNQELSERRAASAKNYLVSQGGHDPVPPDTNGVRKRLALPHQ